MKEPFFREILKEDEEKISMLSETQFQNLMCYLDVGVLALAWCKGKKESRANFLFDICKIVPRISPDGLKTLQPSEYGSTSRRPVEIAEPSKSLISEEDNES